MAFVEANSDYVAALGDTYQAPVSRTWPPGSRTSSSMLQPICNSVYFSLRVTMASWMTSALPHLPSRENARREGGRTAKLCLTRASHFLFLVQKNWLCGAK